MILPPKAQVVFRGPTGNVCLLDLKGIRGGATVIVASWWRSPSRKDMRGFQEWFDETHSREYGHVHLIRIDDPDQRERVAEQILYGGGRN